MNTTIIAIIVLAILAVLAVVLYRRSKRGVAILIYAVGALLIGAGILIFEASSWRNISLTLLALGTAVSAACTVFCVRSKSRSKE